MNKTDIDTRTLRLLNFMSSLQNDDGSFNSMYLQPYYHKDKSWMLYQTVGKTPFDVASSLIPLLFCGRDAKYILQQGKAFFVANSLDCKFWSYAHFNKHYLVPYDSDSTSLSSFVLRELGLNVANANIFNKIQDENSNYKLWIDSDLLYKHLSITGKITLLFKSQYIKKGIPCKTKLILPSDTEFAINCNVLLYLGYNDLTKATWGKVVNDFINQNFDEIYYLNNFHSVYIFARLLGYSNHKINLENEQLESVVFDLLKRLKDSASDNFSLETVLLANTILFFDLPDTEEYNFLFEKCFEDIENSNYTMVAPYYSSSRKTDAQPNTNLPNTYFGSPALTCSLYIEFLNLYRKRYYGSFYGYD